MTKGAQGSNLTIALFQIVTSLRMATRLVLVTGAAGNIGKFFAEHANKQKYKLRLMVGLVSVAFALFVHVSFDAGPFHPRT